MTTAIRTKPRDILAQLPGPDTQSKREACQYALKDGRYFRLLQLAIWHNWPEAYTDDLYIHDRRQCQDYPDVDMIFTLRDHGTHLWPVIKGDFQWSRSVILFQAGDHKLNRYGPDDARAKFFHVPAFGEAVEVTPQEAIDLLTHGRKLNYVS